MKPMKPSKENSQDILINIDVTKFINFPSKNSLKSLNTK